MADDREQFEAWAIETSIHGNEHVLVRVPDGRYLSPLTSSMWAAWQAARRQSDRDTVPRQRQLADALDCAWNPAIAADHNGAGPGSVLAQGLAAVAQRLREFAEQPNVGIGGACGTCGESIRPDELTGTTGACARAEDARDAALIALAAEWRGWKLREGTGWNEAVNLCADSLELHAAMSDQNKGKV